MRAKPLNWIALTLIIIGAINWGLIGFFQFDLVSTIFGGSGFWLTRVIFAIVGIAGLCALGLYGRIENDNNSIAQNTRSH